MKNKRTLALFSGGLDSTHMLELLLGFSDVDVLHVKGTQHPLGYAAERQRLDKIIEVLEVNSQYRVRGRYEVDVGTALNPLCTQANTQQGMLWILAALKIINPDLHSSMNVGYVADDNMYYNGAHLKAIFEHSQMYLMQQAIPLYFPLLCEHPEWPRSKFSMTDKIDILDGINPLVLPHIWVCETPKLVEDVIKPCKKCKSCRTMQQALDGYKLKHGKHVSHRYIKALAKNKDKEETWYTGYSYSDSKRNKEWHNVAPKLFNEQGELYSVVGNSPKSPEVIEEIQLIEEIE